MHGMSCAAWYGYVLILLLIEEAGLLLLGGIYSVGYQTASSLNGALEFGLDS
jgi:hypothetical protein